MPDERSNSLVHTYFVVVNVLMGIKSLGGPFQDLTFQTSANFVVLGLWGWSCVCYRFCINFIKMTVLLFTPSTSAACDVIQDHTKQMVTPPRVNTEPQAPKIPEAPSTAFPVSKASMPAELQVHSYWHFLYVNGFNLVWHLDCMKFTWTIIILQT